MKMMNYSNSLISKKKSKSKKMRELTKKIIKLFFVFMNFNKRKRRTIKIYFKIVLFKVTFRNCYPKILYMT